MKGIKLKFVIFRFLMLVLALIFVFVVVKTDFNAGDDIKYIYGSFIGQKSPYNGIVEVWNIDSFESGKKPKVAYLEAMAKSFQKKYKGVYVIVRNLTIAECENLLNDGERPDLISCSYGVADKIKDYISYFEKISADVFGNFLDAGKIDGKLYALAWCVGFYSLISTKSKLENVGALLENKKLNEIAFNSSYEYKIGKKIKMSKSIVFGEGEFLMPKNALKAYNRARSIQIDEIESEEIKLKSQYSAYTTFLSNDATILLGTHRDVFKMKAREEKGLVSDVIYLPLTNWTDLVQFSFLCKNENKERKEMAERFAVYLTESKNQESLVEIGMFPVSGVDSSLNNGVMSDIISENFSNYELKKIF